MSEWYYADASRQRQGPVSATELADRFHRGQVRLDTLVWRDGLSQWQALRDFSDELALDQSPAEPSHAHDDDGGGRPAFAPALAVATDGTRDSPYAPPTAALASDEAFHAGGEVVQAGFWKRVAAYLIDAFIVGIAAQIVQMVLMAVFFAMNMGSFASNPETMFSSVSGILFLVSVYLFPLAIQAGYYAAFHASSTQATLGKMAVGIKVVRTDGTRITLARGIGRYFGSLLSGLILGIGYLMAAFTDRKQGLHDMICDTLVVDKWAYTAHPEWQKRELGVVTVVVLAIFGALILGMIALVAVIAGLAASAGGQG